MGSVSCFSTFAFIYFSLGNVMSSLDSELPEKNYYVGAVFEHGRRGDPAKDPPEEIKRINLAYCKKATEVAKSRGANIIAFPEYGIIPHADRKLIKGLLEAVPNPKTSRWNPCENASEFSDRLVLLTLSCMAKENGVVVVANMGEIEACTKEEHEKCPDDGAFHFNTNVVFDSDGTIISRSRKEHLYFEIGMDLPVEPQDPYFTTDFGNFASYICFDSLYKPFAEALQNNSIDGVILATMWIDILPKLTSVQRWWSLSIGSRGTLLASNAQIPGYAALGSGLFAGKMGALNYTYNPDGQSKLIVSRVSKNRNQEFPFYNPESAIFVITPDEAMPYEITKEQEGVDLPETCDVNLLGYMTNETDVFKEYRCLAEKTQNYTLVKLTEPKGHITACNKGLCCSLNYSASSMDETFYLAVFNGTYNSYDRYFWCEELCFVGRCLAFKGSECSSFPTKSQTVFRELELKANFTNEFVYPSVLGSGLRLISMDQWTYNFEDNVNGKSGLLRYKNNTPTPLLVAGLYSRCFDRDPPYVR